jgi:hypothetical protein
MIMILKSVLGIGLVSILFACRQKNVDAVPVNIISKVGTTFLLHERKQIADLLDSFNVAASRADFDKYFSYFAEDAVFIGTDATENWDIKSFKVWAKPYFDKGKTWNFSSLDRHIYFDQTGNIAWFDEILNTQMKICRGSGVLTKLGNDWKIRQYVLSMTFPNSQIDTVIKVKAKIEDELIKGLLQK